MRVYYDYTELSKTQFEGDIKMTDLRILHLAYVTAVNNWAKECEHATADPNNSYSKAREKSMERTQRNRRSHKNRGIHVIL